MTAATSLIPGLGAIVQGDDPKLRAEAAHQISQMFLSGAASLQPKHVDLFDGILIDLVPYAELAARVDLAQRLSVLSNAPRGLVGKLASEDELAIAGPLLRRSSVVDQEVLLEIARMKGQGHLLAISERASLVTDLTDIILRRGDREVVRRAAGNAGAQFSKMGYSALIKRAGQDGVLTLTVGQRPDISAPQLKSLLAGSLDVVRRRLLDTVKPERQAEIRQAMSEIAGTPGESDNRRDFAPAQRAILALHNSGALNEAALLEFAKAFKYEESIATLSALTAIKIATLDRLVSGDRHDPILILGKAYGLEWATVRALMLLRLGPSRTSAPADIENARLNFNRLMSSTAERVVSFWQTAKSA